MKKQHLCLLLTLLLLRAECSASGPAFASQTPVGYVLSGNNGSEGFRHNALTLIDPRSGVVQRQIGLPHSWTKNASRDPHGRLWLGFSGNLNKSDTLLQVYSPAGELLQELHPCVAPKAGISFAANRAFVACSERGFSGKVVVVNLETFAVEATIELSLRDAPMLLTASAATTEAVVVAAMTSGPEEALYSVLTLIDPNTLTIRAQWTPAMHTNIWRILSHNGRFLLLNVGSWRQPRAQAQDVLVLDPSDPPQLQGLSLAASPLWGVLVGESLYTYHNPTWGLSDDTHRSVSRLDLTSGQVQTWLLPEQWNADDLAEMQGQIILVKSGGCRDSAAGLYRFDPQSGQIQLLVSVTDASQILGSP